MKLMISDAKKTVKIAEQIVSLIEEMNGLSAPTQGLVNDMLKKTPVELYEVAVLLLSYSQEVRKKILSLAHE